MKLIDLIETNLYELRQRYNNTEGDDKSTLVAFRGDYWVIPYHADMTPDNVIVDIASKLGIDIDDYDGELMDALSEVLDDRPDILYGPIIDNVLYIDQPTAASMHPVSSGMIKKIVAELGLDGVTTSNIDWVGRDEETNFHPTKMTGRLPDVLFHGTNSAHLQNIARIGLRPSVSKSNWNEVSHPDLIFGTSGYEGAIYHANHSSDIKSEQDNYLEPEEDFPVIIEFKIPNRNLIVPDYDVASTVIGHTDGTTALGYTGQNDAFGKYGTHEKITQENPEGRVWKSAGIFGYKGWIPPRYIIRVYTNFFDGALGANPKWSGTLPEFFEEWDSIVKEYNDAFE